LAFWKRTSRHHVPPRHPDEQPKFINNKKHSHREAYELLFGTARTFEEAAAILRKDWWEYPKPGNPPQRFVLKKDGRRHGAYTFLFSAAKSYEDAAVILKHDWWNPNPDDYREENSS